VRTTVDIPDDLYRQIKARAAVRGLKLKEYVTAALRDSLFESQGAADVREPQTEYAADSSVLRDDCVLPLIDGETTEEMRSISEKKIDEILEGDEAEGALPPRGR